MFQYENEAKDVLEVLKRRLGKFMLKVAEDKTRILPIGRFKGTKDEFDYLGFTFFNAKTREGKYRLGISPASCTSIMDLPTPTNSFPESVRLWVLLKFIRQSATARPKARLREISAP